MGRLGGGVIERASRNARNAVAREGVQRQPSSVLFSTVSSLRMAISTSVAITSALLGAETRDAHRVGQCVADSSFPSENKDLQDFEQDAQGWQSPTAILSGDHLKSCQMQISTRRCRLSSVRTPVSRRETCAAQPLSSTLG
jgi:hypothetical protein